MKRATVVTIATLTLVVGATAVPSPVQAVGEALHAPSVTVPSTDCVQAPFELRGGDYASSTWGWQVDVVAIDPSGQSTGADVLASSLGDAPVNGVLSGAVQICGNRAVTGTFTMRATIATSWVDPKKTVVEAPFAVTVVAPPPPVATSLTAVVKKKGSRAWKITGGLTAPYDVAGEPVQIEMRWKGFWEKVKRKPASANGVVVFKAKPQRTRNFDPGAHKFRLKSVYLGVTSKTFRLPVR